MVNIAITLAFHSASPKDKLVSIQRKTGEYDKVFYAFMISVFIFMPIMAILSWVLQLDVPLFYDYIRDFDACSGEIFRRFRKIN